MSTFATHGAPAKLHPHARAARTAFGVTALTLALALVPFLIRSRPAEPLPRLGTLPAFSLVREDGVPFGSAELKGHPYVADFVFTRCPSVCPRMTEKMAGLAPELPAAMRLVSISVDPGYDTPPRLLAYARAHRADLGRWFFLTGDVGRVEETVARGFKVPLAHGGAPGGIVHGAHFVLVDGAGEVRGYYDSNDPERLGRLVRDAEQLIREKR